MTDPQTFIDELYLTLLKQGWTMNDIDTMDIGYFLELMRRSQDRDTAFIDAVL